MEIQVLTIPLFICKVHHICNGGRGCLIVYKKVCTGKEGGGRREEEEGGGREEEEG